MTLQWRGAAFLRAGEAARLVGDREKTYSAERGQGPRGWISQPTTQPTKCDVLHDFRVFRQSPRVCKSL
jgi:hypothetical protein